MRSDDGESKDPGPEGPALVHPAGVMWLISFTGSVQVSGVRCQEFWNSGIEVLRN